MPLQNKLLKIIVGDRYLSVSPLLIWGVKMNEKNFKKRLDFQQKMISRQSQQIDTLKLEIEKLKEKLKEKDEIIRAVEPLRKEMTESIKEHDNLKIQYQKLVDELRQMKKIINVTVYKGRWRLVKWLIK